MRALTAMAAVVGLACACEKPPPPPAFDIEVAVTGDPGEAVEGAKIVFGGEEVGVTGRAGTAKLRLEGQEGEQFSLTIKCPTGFSSPKKPIAITLRRIVGQSKVPRYDVRCAPTTRTIVVAVRATNGPNLPVKYLGQELARTDAFGAAHVMLELTPNSQLQLTLDTTDAANLQPQNPTGNFEVRQEDDVFVFDQEFVVKRTRFYRPRPKPSGPTPL